MPTKGQIAKGRDIGRRGDYQSFIWHACIDCGKERWVILARNKPRRLRCKSCANVRMTLGLRGEGARYWKGGRHIKRGYAHVRIRPEEFYYPMADKNGYVLEHRLVMAQSLNRCLLPWEIIHHKNGIKDDNRLENLELLPHLKYHLIDVKTKAYIKKLENEICRLKLDSVIPLAPALKEME